MEPATIISGLTFLLTLAGVAMGYGKLKGEVAALEKDLSEHKEIDLRNYQELKDQLNSYELKIDRKLDKIMELIIEIKSKE